MDQIEQKVREKLEPKPQEKEPKTIPRRRSRRRSKKRWSLKDLDLKNSISMEKVKELGIWLLQIAAVILAAFFLYGISGSASVQ